MRCGKEAASDAYDLRNFLFITCGDCWDLMNEEADKKEESGGRG